MLFSIFFLLRNCCYNIMIVYVVKDTVGCMSHPQNNTKAGVPSLIW